MGSTKGNICGRFVNAGTEYCTSHQNLSTTCIAIVKQGANKGKACGRQIQNDSKYCGRHQRNKEEQELIDSGKTPCRFHERGCKNLIPKDAENQNTCIECLEKKRIESGKVKKCDSQWCKNNVKEGVKYCDVHKTEELKQKIKESAKERGTKVCDIARGCFNDVAEGYSKCSTCIEKERIIAENELSALRKEKHIIYYGKTDDNIRRKDYICVNEGFRLLKKRAKDSNILCTISFEEYRNIICYPCYYCGFISDDQFVGLDRINNNKGYIQTNVLPCCTYCNLMKQAQHPLEFITKANIINNYINESIPMPMDELLIWRSTFTTKNKKDYSTYKFQTINDREMDFELTKTEYDNIINGRCYLCGIQTGIGENCIHYNGIDRFDSDIGYINTNVKSCCTHCNTMKGRLSFDIFIDQCRLISENNINLGIFENIPQRNTRFAGRTEWYNAYDILNIIDCGMIDNFMGWIKLQKEYTVEFKNAFDDFIRNYNNMKFVSEKIYKLTGILNILNNKDDKKQKSIYSYTPNQLYKIILSNPDEFVAWYKSIYKCTDQFDTKFKKLYNEIPPEKCTFVNAIDKICVFMDTESKRLNYNNKTELKNKAKEAKKTTVNIELDIKTNNSNVANGGAGFDPLEGTNITGNIIITPISTLTLTPVSSASVPASVISDSSSTSEKTKMWRADIVYRHIKTTGGSEYKACCEKMDPDLVGNENWEKRWNTFVNHVRTFNKSTEALESIREFINENTTARKKKCAKESAKKKKVAPKSVEERDKWLNEQIFEEFEHDKTLAQYKKFCEKRTEDNENNYQWLKSWDLFIKDLNKASAENNIIGMKKRIEGFMSALRKKICKRKKHSSTSANADDSNENESDRE